MIKNYHNVPLSVDRLNLSAVIDEDDKINVCRYSWFAKIVGLNRQMLYAARSQTFKDDKGRRHVRTVYMHREIVNAPHGFVVHHINGNTLDNRKCNLCLITQSEHRKLSRLV